MVEKLRLGDAVVLRLRISLFEGSVSLFCVLAQTSEHGAWHVVLRRTIKVDDGHDFGLCMLKVY